MKIGGCPNAVDHSNIYYFIPDTYDFETKDSAMERSIAQKAETASIGSDVSSDMTAVELKLVPY